MMIISRKLVSTQWTTVISVMIALLLFALAVSGCDSPGAPGGCGDTPPPDNPPQSDDRSAVDILASHGFNYARIRLLVDSTTDYGLGQDLAYVTAAAKEAKANGMKFLLDIFYSHWWCDPGQNWKPEIWTETSVDALAARVTSYTLEVLRTLAANGVTPDMVQVGNEVNDGMMWQLGRISVSGWSGYIKLHNAGYDAVKRFSASLPVMTHYAGVGNNATSWYVSFFANGGKSDVLGVSFYEMWHGTISTAVNTLKTLHSAYGKDLYMVETATYWKKSEGGNKTSFAQTEQGQYDYLYTLTKQLQGIAGVKGLFYWGATWTQASKWLTAPAWGDDDAGCRGLFNDSAVANKGVDAIADAGGLAVMGVDISEYLRAEENGVDYADF